MPPGAREPGKPADPQVGGGVQGGAGNTGGKGVCLLPVSVFVHVEPYFVLDARLGTRR